ncbi:MAG TPA: hypothetical protein VGG74_22685 [Kofleriaceae bacterium]
MRSLVACFVCIALVACTHAIVLRGAPTPVAVEPGSRGTTLAMPRVGDAYGANLADGWPVWVIRHYDGTVTVASAVATHDRSAATLFQPDAALVAWVAGTRQLLAEDVAYDERGRAIGYADDDCFGDCPHIVEPLPAERDLDTFEAAVVGNRIVVGPRVAAPPAREVSRWVAYDERPHASRELVVPGEQRVAEPIAMADALARPIGSYALVTGSIVQSTVETPHLCACGACDADSPLAYGIPAVQISAPTAHAESGTLLVRRDPGGFTVIASSDAGACPTR